MRVSVSMFSSGYVQGGWFQTRSCLEEADEDQSLLSCEKSDGKKVCWGVQTWSRRALSNPDVT